MVDSPTHPGRSGPANPALGRPGRTTIRTTATGRHLTIAAPMTPAPTGGLDKPAPPRQDLADEEAREVYAELLSIARATTDRALRNRLDVLCDRLAPPPEPALIDVPRLTARELQVLGEIALGRTNSEVAERLSIMPTTVKTYLKNTMRKFGTRNRVETILAARRAGVLSR
ncbi:MAG TPA: helix-turn-helix transcriptional regulator [Pseudonocardia sp.]|jgi:DNA-binding NarL/FixJ family response regulator|nr:helix-turn-helix transcriptional regulator [Pseudonocardia sp.]